MQGSVHEPLRDLVWSSGINFSEFFCLHQFSDCQLSLFEAASVCLPSDLLPPGNLELGNQTILLINVPKI